MQIVYLSNRPQVMRDTWQHVRHFMPWVDRAVVVAPAASHSAFRAWADPREVVLVADEEASGLGRADLLALDHVRRNVTLRRGLIAGEHEAGDVVDDVFLLSDDDYRPLREVPESFFTEDGRDIGYYSYELAAWPGHTSDFDEAQHATHDTLTFLGMPHLAYGAHMPQIMRRDIWREVFELYDGVSESNMLCEWAWYFNAGRHLHPERFAEPRPFETMGWPQYGAEWPWWVAPPRLTFENFYEDMYEPGHLFDGLPVELRAEDAIRTNLVKIRRWTDFARAARRYEFPEGVYNPWVQDSPVRKLFFRALRPLRKAHWYLTHRDDPTEVPVS